jgi:hypothetical protein
VLEAVYQLGVVRAREDEVDGMEILQVARHLIALGLTDVGHERNAEAAADHRGDLECPLGRVGHAVHPGGDDVADRRRHRHVGRPKPRLSILDDDALRLLQLPDDLLDIQGIALALGQEELEERL